MAFYMAKYCSDECEKTGGSCNFCWFFHHKVYTSGGVLIDGLSVCGLNFSETDKANGFCCNNFHYINISSNGVYAK